MTRTIPIQLMKAEPPRTPRQPQVRRGAVIEAGA